MTTYTSDTFTAADGTTFPTHTPDVGTAYDADSGDGIIESNALTNTTFGSARARANPPPASADYKVTADMSAASGSGSNGMALILRCQSTAGGDEYDAGYDTNLPGWYISVLVSGVATVLDSVSTPTMPVVTTRHVEFEANGSVLTLTVDSTLLLTVIDTTYTTTGQGGWNTNSFVQGWWTMDNFTVEDGGVGGAGVHVVSGRGNFAVSSPLWLSTAIAGRPSVVSSGAAEPPNWYHVGMLSWGTANGAMQSYPVTRDLDLVQLPAGLDTVWFEFIAGVTATITELAAP